jgi:phospholipase/carboxylesterase
MATTIHTIERKPQLVGDQPPPLLLMLHGYGSNEHDLFDLAEYVDPRLHIVSARAPLQLSWGGFAWYHLSGTPGRLVPDTVSRAEALTLLDHFVTSLPERLGSDPRRTYMLGFSQGAIMSLALAMNRPELIAGVVALSGYLDPAIVPPTPSPALAGLPIIQMHGTYDEIIPVAAAHQTQEVLRGMPVRHSYHEYPVGHTIHPDGLRHIQSWLATRLDEPPR